MSAVCDHCGSGVCLQMSKQECRHTGKLRITEPIPATQQKMEVDNKRERRNNGKNHKARRR